MWRPSDTVLHNQKERREQEQLIYLAFLIRVLKWREDSRYVADKRREAHQSSGELNGTASLRRNYSTVRNAQRFSATFLPSSGQSLSG